MEDIGRYSSSGIDDGLMTLHEHENDFNNSNLANSTIVSIKEQNSISDKDMILNIDENKT